MAGCIDPLGFDTYGKSICRGCNKLRFVPAFHQAKCSDCTAAEKPTATTTIQVSDNVNWQQGTAYKSPSGAQRSEKAPRYHLLPPAAHKAWADRMALGEKSHGSFNWLKGQHDEDFQIECLNHLIEHVRKFAAGDRSDDHMAAVMCSAAFLREFLALGTLKLPTNFSSPQERDGST